MSLRVLRTLRRKKRRPTVYVETINLQTQNVGLYILIVLSLGYVVFVRICLTIIAGTIV